MERLIRPDTIEVKETLINFILDETGSMAECLNATISGFNEYIQTLKGESTEEASIRMSLTKFNSNKQNGAEIVFTNRKIGDVSMLDNKNYVPNAMTPLYDAIGKTVKFVEEELLKKKRKKQPKIVCVIMTDGLENDSKTFTKENIVELIKEKEGDGWNFVYLGANQDAWEVGISIGLSKGNISAYTPTAVGYQAAFRSLAADTISYHHCHEPLTKSFVSRSYEVKGGKLKKNDKKE